MSDTIGTTSGSASAAANSSGSDSSSSIGKCPVDHKNRSLWGVLGNIGGGGGSNTSTSNGSGSDSDSSSSTKQQRNTNITASLEEAAMYAQTPLPNQRQPLSTHRHESSIPRGDNTGVNENDGDDKNNNNNNKNNLPAHQIQISKLNENVNENENNKWVYPSEQQVFNAMKRKGWKGIEEESIPSFLQVHNSVNERSWKDVCKWEEQNKIELVRFEGRPKDLSPKAWFLSTFLFQDKPFDRHDWYVSNDTQKEKRYVLDFYMTDNAGRGDEMMMPRVEIDVRPALDNPEAFVQRGKHLIREMFPGISREIDERMSK
jgi:cytochrome c heme-lyase